MKYRGQKYKIKSKKQIVQGGERDGKLGGMGMR